MVSYTCFISATATGGPPVEVILTKRVGANVKMLPDWGLCADAIHGDAQVFISTLVCSFFL